MTEIDWDLDRCYGMVWILAHWLMPHDAGREELEALIRKASENWEKGYELGQGDNTPW